MGGASRDQRGKHNPWGELEGWGGANGVCGGSWWSLKRGIRKIRGVGRVCWGRFGGIGGSFLPRSGAILTPWLSHPKTNNPPCKPTIPPILPTPPPFQFTLIISSQTGRGSKLQNEGFGRLRGAAGLAGHWKGEVVHLGEGQGAWVLKIVHCQRGR